MNLRFMKMESLCFAIIFLTATAAVYQILLSNLINRKKMLKMESFCLTTFVLCEFYFMFLVTQKLLISFFFLSHPKGIHGNRTAWGGEIGGLIVLDKETKNFYSQSLDSFSGKEPSQAYNSKKNKFVYKSENITLPKIKSYLEV